jgi:Tol biopolymer transport system component
MRCGSAVGFVVCGMAALGCSDGSGPADDTGSIEVTVAMNGEALDPDGFDVFIDGEKAGTMAGAGSLTLRDLTPGSHDVALEQVAPFCQGGTASTADVVVGGTADVTFALDCIAGPGGTIVFRASYIWSPTNLGELVALDMVTGRVVRIAEEMPFTVLSPDGSKLAYVTLREGSNPTTWDLVIADADGSNPVTTELPGGGFELAWSPDGSAIVFVARRDATVDMFIMDATGANLRPVFATVNHRRNPDWSVTGRLAYSAFDPPNTLPIWTADLDGSNEALLTPAVSAFVPAWSPDGSQVAYMTFVEETLRLHVMDADGANPRMLTNLVGRDELTPRWSPDGEWIVFATDDNDRSAPPTSRLMAIRPSGGPVVVLNDDYHDFFVTPDRWLAGE